MSQISPPIRIVLVAVVGLMAAWMLFLRPKSEPVPASAPAPATAPGVTGLGKAVEKAEGAAATQEARDAEVQKATGDDAGAATGGKSGAKAATPATLPASGRVLTLSPLPADATEDLPAGVRRALDRRQVFAIAVLDTSEKRWARMAADDRRVRRELSKANRYGGKVSIATASLGELHRLDPIIGDLDVSQTPSVVVVDRNRRATVLSGYVERHAINQAIADARRDSIEWRIKEPYLRRLNETCANYGLRVDRFALPSTRGGIKPASRRLSRLVTTYRASFGRLGAPGRWKPLQAQVMKVVRGQERFVAALKTGNLSVAGQSLTALDTAAVGLDRRLDRAGVTTCVSNRRS